MPGRICSKYIHNKVILKRLTQKRHTNSQMACPSVLPWRNNNMLRDSVNKRYISKVDVGYFSPSPARDKEKTATEAQRTRINGWLKIPPALFISLNNAARTAA